MKVGSVGSELAVERSTQRDDVGLGECVEDGRHDAGAEARGGLVEFVERFAEQVGIGGGGGGCGAQCESAGVRKEPIEQIGGVGGLS